MNKLKINKKDFMFFLDSLAKISDSAILTVEDGGISAIGNTQDSSLIIWNRIECEHDDDVVLNIPSVGKLLNAIKLCGDIIEITFTINRNHLEYKGTNIKFKYHLYEDGILTKSKMSLTKLKSIKYDINLNVKKTFLKDIMKVSGTFSDTNKLRIYSEDDKIMWALQDLNTPNVDSVEFKGDDTDVTLPPFIMSVDNLRLLTLPDSDNLMFNINTTLGFGNFALKSGAVDLNYIIASFIK